MSTFLQMQQRIADDLNRTDLTTQIKKAITRAILYYQKEPFWFKETSSTFSTIVGQKSYGTSDSIPTDISSIRYVEITISGNHDEVKSTDISWIESNNPTDAQGWVTKYAWFKNKFYFYLVPNQIWTVTVYYTKTYTELSADSDTNDWTTYAEDLIESRAKWWLYSRIIKSSDDALTEKQNEMDALQGLREISDGYVGQPGVEPTEF